MAEVGWVASARTSLEICKQVLPAHRSKYFKRVFTQPQLLAVLCLMRREDWTTREAEVRRALELDEVPDPTTWCKFVARREEEAIARALELIAAQYLRSKGSATLAVDATGLSPSGLSTSFVCRRHHHQGKALDWKHGLVGLAVVDVSTASFRSDVCWPMPSSTVKATTSPSIKSSVQRASFRPNEDRPTGRSRESVRESAPASPKPDGF